jgi:hypothetical protein
MVALPACTRPRGVSLITIDLWRIYLVDGAQPSSFMHYISEEGSELSLLDVVGSRGAKSRILIGSYDESVVCVESLALAGARSSARKAIEETLGNYGHHVSTFATRRSFA